MVLLSLTLTLTISLTLLIIINMNNFKAFKKSTLKDIAEASGFSINTVSRVLRGKNDIKKGTKDKINSIAKNLNYVPNYIAGSLRSGKTRTIAIIIPDIVNPLFAIWAKAAEMLLNKKGYDSLILNTDEDYKAEENVIKIALRKNVEGIIICPVQKDYKNIKYLKEIGFPFILVGRHFKEFETDYVVMDDYKGGYIATEYLIKKNIKDILFLNANIYISSAEERLNGYKGALRSNGINIKKELIKYVDIVKRDDCDRIIRELKENNIKYSGVFSFSDLIAWRMIYFLKKHGIRVPEDKKIIGFDNIQSYFLFPYNLTSIGYSQIMIIEEAVNILLKKTKKEKQEDYTQIVIPTNIHIGESA